MLEDTLAWAYARPGILNVGIVPLGFTKHQAAFARSFNDPADARAVLDAVAPFQDRALAERGTPWAFAADEFYRNAFGADLLENLPPAERYGDFGMFEDGIGIVRSYVDDWRAACACGRWPPRCAEALRAAGVRARFVVGEAMQPLPGPAGGGRPPCGRLRAPHGGERVLRRQRGRDRPSVRLRHDCRHQPVRPARRGREGAMLKQSWARTKRPGARSGAKNSVRTVHWTVRHAELRVAPSRPLRAPRWPQPSDPLREGAATSS